MAQRQQFLNFDKPEFVDDFVYTPPFEMMDRALKVNQEGMDTAIATANLFHNLNIDYIDDEQQRQRVGEIINKYAGQADNVAALIRQDPSKWRQQGAALSGLKNQLAQDFQYGEIYRTQKNAENWKAFQAELEKIKDVTTKQALKDEAMQKWRASYKDADGNYKWNTALYDKTQGIDRPDMVADIKAMGIGQDEINLTKDLFSSSKRYDAKLNAVVGDFDKFTGKYGYIREVKESEKESYKKVQNAIDGYMELPETIAFEKQQERLRQAGLLDERYYDDEGNRLSIGESSWKGAAQMALQLGERNSERSDKWRTNETELYYDRVAREKKKEQDEIEANLFTVQTPVDNQGAAFNNEMNALLYTGTTNADGTQTAGLLKQIYGDKASMVEAAMRKQADPFAYLIDRLNADTTMGEKKLKATGETKKQLLERLEQYRNRELRLRASGTTPLATVVGAEESVKLHKIFNNGVNTHYETISYKVGDGDATIFRDFNNGAMMYEVSPIKVDGKEVIVPRVGKLGRNRTTGEIIEIPATMPIKKRLDYEPVLGASLIKNSGTIQPVNQGGNKQGYVGWNNIQFEFGRKKGAKGNTQQVLQASTPMDLSKGGLISIGANTPETRAIENPTYSSPTVNSTVTQTTRAKLADIGSYFKMTPQDFQSSVNGKRITGFISGDAKVAQHVTSAWENLIKNSSVPNTTGNRDAFFSYLEKEYPGIKASYQRGIAEINALEHSWQTTESPKYNTGNHMAPIYNYDAPLSDLFK